GLRGRRALARHDQRVACRYLRGTHEAADDAACVKCVKRGNGRRPASLDKRLRIVNRTAIFRKCVLIFWKSAYRCGLWLQTTSPIRIVICWMKPIVGKAMPAMP